MYWRGWEAKVGCAPAFCLFQPLSKLRQTAFHDACMADETRRRHLVIAAVGPTIEVRPVLEGGSRTEALP
ncbi:hypothetical protein X772_23835 [Mesorhizobium sp. LSJC280B00]|nr:hypothetical protein X772_23835 [Mesorhizobium sp. LSJC280B00]